MWSSMSVVNNFCWALPAALPTEVWYGASMKGRFGLEGEILKVNSAFHTGLMR